MWVAEPPSLVLETIAEGLTAPIHIEQPNDGSGHMLIVQQNGVVLVVGEAPMDTSTLAWATVVPLTASEKSFYGMPSM